MRPSSEFFSVEVHRRSESEREVAKILNSYEPKFHLIPIGFSYFRFADSTFCICIETIFGAPQGSRDACRDSEITFLFVHRQRARKCRGEKRMKMFRLH